MRINSKNCEEPHSYIPFIMELRLLHTIILHIHNLNAPCSHIGFGTCKPPFSSNDVHLFTITYQYYMLNEFLQ